MGGPPIEGTAEKSSKRKKRREKTWLLVDVDWNGDTKHASIKMVCGRQFGEFDALLWVWSVKGLVA